MAPPSQLDGPLSLFSFLHQSSSSGAIALMASGMALMGAATGFIYNPLNNLMVEEASYAGFPIKKSADPIASILNQTFTLGGFFGPLLSTTLVHHLGFPKSCALFGITIFAFMSISTPLIIMILKRRNTQSSNDTDTESSYSLLYEASDREDRQDSKGA